MDFTTPVPERSGTPAQRSGPSTPQAGMASVDASSPLVGTEARKAKQAERLASRARVRSSIRRDLSGKGSSVPPVGSQQDAEQPAAEEDIEEGGQELQGQYLCFTRIWEGQDEDGLEAARNYIKTIVGMRKVGQKGPKKQAWVKQNGFTKRVAYLYLKSMVIQRWMEKSSHIRQYGAAPAPPWQSAGQPQQPKATQGTRPRTAAAKSTASPKPAVGANSPVGSGKQTGKQTPRPQTSTTSTPTSTKETKALHGKMKNLMASASDILAEISANDEWKSVRHFCGPTDVARKTI